MGLIHFVRKFLLLLENGLYFWLGPIKISIQISCEFCSNVDINLKILGPIKFCKGPIKILKGPLKFA